MIDDKRTALLESTVRAVAKYGMKDISTRNISSDAGVNDAYIYRYFENKEDLLVQAYLLENHKFMHHVIRQIDLVRKQMSAAFSRTTTIPLILKSMHRRSIRYS